MNSFNRTERFEIEDGQLVRIITATGTGKHFLREMDVAKQYESGKIVYRNIDYRGPFGYTIAWPGEHYKTYCYGYKTSDYIAEVDPWFEMPETSKLENFCYKKVTETDKAKVLSLYPEFKWVFNKSELSYSELLHILPCWKQHPQQVEMLLGAGYRLLALNKSIYKLKDPKKILNFIKANKPDQGLTLNEIQGCQKYNCTLKDWRDYKSHDYKWMHIAFDEYQWLKTSGQEGYQRLYKDYKEMCIKAGHDWSDKYWRYPKDVRKAHDKVMKQIRRMEKLKEKAQREQKQKAYTEAIAKMIRKLTATESGNIKVYLPETIEQIEHQAEALHQCLITADYIKHVIDGKCWLVFVTKNNRPFATCEILRTGKKLKVGQFYGNERNQDYHAKPDAIAAFNEWAKANKIKVAA